MSEITLNGTAIPLLTSPNSSARPPSPQGDIRLIVLHSTGGNFESAKNWLLDDASDVSAHFLVARTCAILQLVPLARAAWHAGESAWQGQAVRNSVNGFSIGIEMEHVDGGEDWPVAQLTAVTQLMRALMAAYRVPVGNVVGHADVARPTGRKVDPQHFPWPNVRAALISPSAGSPVPHVKLDKHLISGRIIDNTLYVPARDLAEALGYAGRWDSRNLELLLTPQ